MLSHKLSLLLLFVSYTNAKTPFPFPEGVKRCWTDEHCDEGEKCRPFWHGCEKFESNLVDMNFTNLWKPYRNLSRNTNLNFKDLLGSYEILDCPSVTTLGKITRFPIYYKILPDGKKAYLHKNRFGNVWQV